MDYMHSDKKASNLNLYAIELALEALSVVDMKMMAPLAKVVYASGREVDDAFLWYHSNMIDAHCDYVYALHNLVKYFPMSLKLLKPTPDLTINFVYIRRYLERLVSKIGKKINTEEGKDMFKKSQKDAALNITIDELNALRKHMSDEQLKEIETVVEEVRTSAPSGESYTKNVAFLRECAKLSFGKNDTIDETDMGKVLDTLNNTHFGMDDAKELVVEFMAIKQLNKEADSPQFIFAGPAGTGKTTLAIRIGEALGRKVARVSLGGIDNASALRGHSRTYLGSKCGRIMNAIIKTGVSNPVIILDEIDKMSEMGSADSALLEILDPAQNVGFTDSYFNFAYDLSNVIFIATANYLERIDAPLLDRMETIECDGYTLNEKIKIGTEYIIPKTMKAQGLKDKDIKFSKATLKHLINGYTREAGMRSLEQAISKILRGAVLQIVKGKKHVSITKKYVEKRMGQIIFDDDTTINTTTPGTVNGLAVMGGFTGCVIQLESSFTTSNGIKMLGDTGKMMDNSCETVQVFLDNNMERYGIDRSISETVGIATLLGTISTPSDGDSASITLLTSWVSLLLDRPVNPKVAMTGSISLNGEVRAIGGLDHKVAAGVRSGIDTFIISHENEKDYNKLPKEIKNAATFHIVKHVDEVMFHALNVVAVDLEEDDYTEEVAY